jgi:hypothetical protein
MLHQKDQLRKLFLFLKKYRKVALEPRSRVDAICQDRKTVSLCQKTNWPDKDMDLIQRILTLDIFDPKKVVNVSVTHYCTLVAINSHYT